MKGASVLIAHKHFNICTGPVIDIMHCLFGGDGEDPDGLLA